MTNAVVLTVAPAQLSLEKAIIRTVVYADVFDYALTPVEIHYYLAHLTASLAEVQAALATSTWLAERLTRVEDYVVLTGREHLPALRVERERSSAELWRSACFWAQWIALAPFVRMVAVTGALAVNNAPAGDDIDYLLVTEPGRVWLARAWVIGLVYLARWGGAHLCPNYIVASHALVEERQDAFTAHDLAQMVILSGVELYRRMRAANPWVLEYLPQAYALPPQPHRPLRPVRLSDVILMRCGRGLQQLAEWFLGGRLGDALETWEFRRKQRKFAPRLWPNSAAQVTPDRLKGFFSDHGTPILRQFEARLAQYL